jgi:predicted amidohydrolase YtcJ
MFMAAHGTNASAREPMTIFTARRIITMDHSLPDATAVGVIGKQIVAVGDLDSMAAWREQREVTIDDRFRDKVLMPGLIDNHIHPFLGAMLMPMEIIAPEAWRKPDGTHWPAAQTPDEYLALLKARLDAKTNHQAIFISFGYQPALHGKLFRRELDELCPDRAVILWQRSFHETYLNTLAIEQLGIKRDEAAAHPQCDLENGHFFETGNKLVVARLRGTLMAPTWYRHGLSLTADLMQQGGITTAGDMLFGSLGPEFELDALHEVFEQAKRPVRVVNVFDARSFGNRASGRPIGPPDTPIDFAAGLPAIEALRAQPRDRVWYAKAIKLFADGAMFSQLMQMRPPGYIDGHHGEWLMSPEVLDAGVQAFWDAGYQIHVHVNGDAGMDAVLAALTRAQARKPRFDHRFHVHHVGYCAAAQIPRLAALGAHASVNPYYIHALTDDYSAFGLGTERASQITRCASMLQAGMRISFHSDFMMAPTEPLLLAWCAATRRTRSGAVASPAECLTLEQALRGVTIDAAWGLGLEDQIGSISCGKLADFAVLEDDPFELGVDRLKDVRICGTVFEGTPHLLTRPMASVHASTMQPAEPLHRLADTEQGRARRPHRQRRVMPASREDSVPAQERTGPYRRLKPLRANCCDPGQDRCDLIRQWGVWLAGA